MHDIEGIIRAKCTRYSYDKIIARYDYDWAINQSWNNLKDPIDTRGREVVSAEIYAIHGE